MGFVVRVGMRWSVVVGVSGGVVLLGDWSAGEPCPRCREAGFPHDPCGLMYEGCTCPCNEGEQTHFRFFAGEVVGADRAKGPVRGGRR